MSKNTKDDADEREDDREDDREDQADEADERDESDESDESGDDESDESGDDESDESDDDGADDDDPGDDDHASAAHGSDAHGDGEHDAHEEVALEPDKPPNALIFVAIAAICASVVGFVVLSAEWFNFALRGEHDKYAVTASPQLRELRVLEDKKLGGYAWINQGQNIVRIPVDRALELTLRDWKTRPKDEPPAAPPSEPKNEPAKTEGCDFEGKHYAAGDVFKADCNTCRCDKYGDKYFAACTELACGVDEKAETQKVDKDAKADECSYNDEKHALGTTFKAKNGCDTCRCEKVDDKAAVLCTKLACEKKDGEKADEKKDEKKDGDKKPDEKKDGEKKAP